MIAWRSIGYRVSQLPVGRIWHYATTNGVPRRALWMALVVGTILNLINQGDALFGAKSLSLGKLILTYVVPYCVSTYSTIAYRMATETSADRDDEEWW